MSAHTYPTVNLVIDVHDHDAGSKMDKAEHDRYIEKIKNSVEALRERVIPTIYIAIGDSSEAFRGADTRDHSVLNFLRLNEVAPQPGDDIFLKRFMSGFTDKADVLASPVLEAYVVGQRKDGADYAKAASPKPTLLDLLREKGATHVTIMGEAAQFCITDNAIDAARNGLGVTILSDAVAGWTDETYKTKNWRAGTMTWHEGNPAYHEDQINKTLREVKDNPVARGLDEDKKAIETIIKTIAIRPVAKFLESLPAQKAIAPAIPSAGKKPGAIHKHL